jgi:hypothetical protein
MDNLGDLTMNELIDLAKVAKHKRQKHNEAMKRYRDKNIEKFREIWKNEKRKTRLLKNQESELI